MENAVDALKIAGAILIFGLGLTILFNLTAKARETASFLISETDRTKYYTYYEEATEETIDQNGNRVVKLKDIIPAMYRYSEENYGITIVNKTGEIVARLDLDTESICNNWYSPTISAFTKWKFINETNNVIKEVNTLATRIGANKVELIKMNWVTTQTDENGNPTDGYFVEKDGMTELFEKLYLETSRISTRSNTPYCRWLGNTGWTSQRIDSDLSRNRRKI